MTDADFYSKDEPMLTAIWMRHRPVVEQRLDLLDRVAADAEAGALIDELREEAASIAHKLAGSLGMYGYDEGTLIARQIEVMLLAPAPPDAARLGTLVAELRRAIFPET
jgi:HPt (histidine-containing phosphotransfer) domain-containing protein